MVSTESIFQASGEVLERIPLDTKCARERPRQEGIVPRDIHRHPRKPKTIVGPIQGPSPSERRPLGSTGCASID